MQVTGGIMYAVIRAGGKQYRVAPGDVVKIEKTGGDGNVDFDVLAVSGDDGKIGIQKDAEVVGEVLGEGRADKILVFHFKRKKQYKKLAGHRQPFTQVRISKISFGGKSYDAPKLEKKAPKAKKTVEATPKGRKAKGSAQAAAQADAPVKKTAAKKKTPAKKTAAKKSTKKK
jgi:large subunit ribosomal protein L21